MFYRELFTRQGEELRIATIVGLEITLYNFQDATSSLKNFAIILLTAAY